MRRKRKRPNPVISSTIKKIKRRKLNKGGNTNIIQKRREKMKKRKKILKNKEDKRSDDVKVVERTIKLLKKKIKKQNDQIQKSIKRAVAKEEREKKKKKKKEEKKKKRTLLYVQLTKRQCEEIDSNGTRILNELDKIFNIIQNKDNRLNKMLDEEEELVNRLAGLGNYYFNTHHKNMFFSLDLNEEGIDLIAPKFV